MNQELIDRVLQSPRLPSLPEIALKVIDLVQQDEVSIKQIAETIQNDPALASKILKTVNSSFYGQSSSVSTISHALVVLGLNAVKTLALGFSLVGNLQGVGGENFDHFRFWKRNLSAATAAKALARKHGIGQQEEVFLGGLLQDLGVLAMIQALGKQYGEVLEQSGPDHAKLGPAERKILQIDHAEVGAALAAKWKLPPLLIAPIRFHESPENATLEVQSIVHCVAIGNVVADMFITEKDSVIALDEFYRLANQWFALTRPDAELMLVQIHSQTKEMLQLFDLPTSDLAHHEDILAQANDALMQITLQAQHQSTQLEQQNRKLSDQAYTDALTGVANRRRFDESVREQFEAARCSGKPLSVIFLDGDRFKSFNDTYGHATGDRVIIALAMCLSQVVGDRGLVTRYGGEEFAVILPGADLRTATVMAEQVRQKIERVTVRSDKGQSLGVTASIGAAAYEGVFFTSAEQLVKAADQGVYAAKDSGRNCVRIFTPPAYNKDAA